MPPATQKPSNTKELISNFHVCWDVGPEYIYIKHEKRQIGFVLELSGAHENGSENPEPGCENCREVYQALVQIAQEVLPRGDEDCTHQFEPYDPSIHYSSRHGNRPEVTLTIRIMHRKAFERPVDASQVQYLNELQARLEAAGIRQCH